MFLQGEALILPGSESAGQWPDAGDALSSQEQRHTGAGGFIGSSAIEHDVAIAGNLLLPRFQFFWIQAECAGKGERLRFKFDGMAQIHYLNLFASIQFGLEFFGRDSGNAKGAEEFLALVVFAKDISGQPSN